MKTIAAALLLAWVPALARAQGVRPSPAAGERLRVSPGGAAPYTGRLVALGGDTLLLRPEAGGADRFVSLSAQPVEVLRPHRERWSALGALLGAAVGVGSAMALSKNDGSSHHADVLIVGSAAGAIVGGTFGFAVAPRRWQRLQPAPRAVPLPPPARAVQAAASH